MTTLTLGAFRSMVDYNAQGTVGMFLNFGLPLIQERNRADDLN